MEILLFFLEVVLGIWVDLIEEWVVCFVWLFVFKLYFLELEENFIKEFVVFLELFGLREFVGLGVGIGELLLLSKLFRVILVRVVLFVEVRDVDFLGDVGEMFLVLFVLRWFLELYILNEEFLYFRSVWFKFFEWGLGGVVWWFLL